MTSTIKNNNTLNVHVLQLALDCVNVGTWDWQFQTGGLVIDARWAEIVGYTLEELEPISIQTWLTLSHPDDLVRSQEALSRHFRHETEYYELEARMRHKEGHWVWVLDRGKVIEWDENDQPRRMFGAHLEITEKKQNELDRLNSQYRDFVENAPFSIFISRQDDSIITYANKRAIQQFKLIPDPLNPKSTAEFYFDPSTQAAFLNKLFQLRTVHDYELQLINMDGDQFWALVSASLTTFDNVPSVLIAINDINLQKQTQEELNREKDRYRLLTDTMADVIWVYSIDLARFTFVSPSITALSGYSVDEALDHDLESIMTPESYQTLIGDYRSKLQVLQKEPNQKISSILEIQQLRKNGTMVWVELSSTLHQTPQGLVEIVGSARNIDERKRIENRLEYLNHHDSTTGLLNRNALRLALDNAERNNQLSGVTLVHIDMDNFGLINDALGHDKGDQILSEIGKKIEDYSRKYGHVYHYGGDEFIIVLNNLDLQSVEIHLRELSQIISSQLLINEQIFILTASIGYAPFREGKSVETVLKNSDTALYLAKRQRNSIKAYKDEMSSLQSREAKLENDLRFAIERQELELYYQPIYNVASSKIDEAEALIRWNHPDLGLVMPVDFIPIAEKTRLILPITDWVIHEACQKLALWDKTNGDLTISINISFVTIANRGDELFNYLKNEILISGIKPYRLKLEVTESSLVQDAVEVIKVFIRLKELGLRLALDDFGTGYSSFAYLKALPLDIVKIDRSLIKTIEWESKTKLIVETMITFLHGLNLDVVVEGVENENQLYILKKMNADMIQGYFFSKPLTWNAFNAYAFSHQKMEFNQTDRNNHYEIILHWRDEWNSGNDTIDDQHKELMKMTAKLENASTWEASEPLTFQGHIRLLIDKIKKHFEDEESILKGLFFPEFDNHKQEHLRLVRQTDIMFELYQKGQLDVYAFVTFVVQDVIWDHILLEDVRYFPYISTLRSQDTINYIPDYHQAPFTHDNKSFRILYAENISFQSAISQISTDFINVDLTDFDEKVQQALALCAKQVKADRAYLFKYDWQRSVCDNTYEWCQSDILPQIEQLQGVPLEAIQDWVNAHLMGETINIPEVSQLDPESDLRKILEPQSIQSLLTVPMMVDNICYGFIGFDSVKQKHFYSDYERSMLQEVSNVLLVAFKRKNIEEELIQEKKFYEMTVSSLNEALIILDSNGVIVNHNQVAGSFLSNHSNLRGKHIQEVLVLFDHKTHQPVTLDWNGIISEGGKVDFAKDVGFIKNDGEKIFVSGSITTDTDNTSKTAGTLINFRDVTLEIEAEKQIEAFLNVNLDILVVADLNGNFVKVNKKCSEVLGYSFEELEGKSFLELVHPDDLDKTLAMLSEIEKLQLVSNFTNRYKTKSGQLVHLEWQAQIGYGKHLYASARDVTDRVSKTTKAQIL